VAAKFVWCKVCGARLRYLTAGEAIFGGFGIIDLIPGVRDLPWLLRLMLTFVAAIAVVFLVFILPLRFG
jgi:hypothetical protein